MEPSLKYALKVTEMSRLFIHPQATSYQYYVYLHKAVALSDLEIDRLSSDNMSDDSVNVNKLRSELLDDGLFEIEC